MLTHSLQTSSLVNSDLLDDEQDPMGSIGNLMDVMLVFACGLLLALIAHWNVDLNAASSAEGSGVIKELDGNLEAVEQGIATEDGSYKELGVVYQDEETGTLYVVS